MAELERRTGAAVDGAVGNAVEAALTAHFVQHGLIFEGANLAAALGGSLAEQLAGALRAGAVTATRRVQRFLTRAGETVERPAEELITTARADERKLDLLVQAVDAASKAAAEAKLDALAFAFASGVIADDVATVEEYVLVVDTLAQLEVVHLRLLGVLVDHARDPDLAQVGDARRIAEELRDAWKREDVLAREPGLATIYDSLIAKLQALGLVYDEGRGRWAADHGYTSYWQLTEFGRLCARTLVERGGDAEASDGR